MAVSRYDTGALGRVERTPQGGIRVQANLSRTGLFRYQNPDGSVRIEYRPPDEVSRPESLATLRDAPVTNLHHGLVTPGNFRKTAIGNLSGEARMDGQMIVGTLAIQDERAIRMIEAGERREVSLGYRCELDRTPGTTPEGERYDAVQRNIVYNHVALVPRGRGGREVALRLDSHDNQVGPVGQENRRMEKFEVIGGVPYEVGSAAHQEASRTRATAEAAVQTRLDSISGLEGENATLKAKVKELEERLDSLPESIEAAVQGRIKLLGVASRAGFEVREDMSDDDIRAGIVGKVHPKVNLDGKDSAFVSAAFEIAAASLESGKGNSATQVREDAVRARRGTPSTETREDSAPALAPDEAARQAMIDRARKRSNTRRGVDKG